MLNSYSQLGEDRIIDKMLGGRSGFYVDVGTNDPFRFSNTARFWKKGWMGITIEPDPLLHENIKKVRTDGINLNVGVGTKKGILPFYKFEPHTLSTFSEEEKNKYLSEGYKLQGIVDVPVITLGEILKKHADKKQIDLLSIDTEGFDYEVLQSNDWTRFKPKLICIEAVEHVSGKPGKLQKKQEAFILSHGYKKVYENKINAVYERDN